MKPKRDRPNILIIHCDQLRWDSLGSFGNVTVHTPHIDRLAEDSVRFTNSFCTYPICTPSRYSLLSGLYVHQHGSRSNRSTLAPGINTFPRALLRAGYRTKAVGKMHFTPTYLDVGFEEMELAEQHGPGRLDDDYHRELIEHGLIDAVDLIDQSSNFRCRAPESYWQTYGAQQSDLPEEWHSTTWIADRAIRTLQGWSDAANLLTIGFVKPHHPFDPPEPWNRMYDPNEIAIPEGWLDEVPARDQAYHAGYFPNSELTEGTLRRVIAHYYATISQIDHQIGRMLDLLKQKRLYDDSLIIFTGDHGEYLGFHHMILKGGYLYDPLMRVPLMIKFPGDESSGTARDTLVSNVDIAPTILSLLGIRPSPEMSGLDLASETAERTMVFAEARKSRMYMARSQHYKLLLGEDIEGSLLFDLGEDPLELTNCIGDPRYDAIFAELRDGIADWLMFGAPVPDYCDLRAPNIDRPNVPDPDDDHRQRRLEYFDNRLTEYLSSTDA